jgi:2-polyprenyl-6-methoxyphenol hydroxylase-like FAD-dependent oxidoreductase
MAGLIAGRILADHFEQVTILERDALEQGPTVRKGAPQAHHIHALLHRGATTLERLFPGVFEEIRKDGGLTGEMGPDFWYYQLGAWKLRVSTGLILQLQSRPLLEWGVRRRVMALENVRALDGCSVMELAANESRTRITGVRYQRGPEALEEPADLVVDASGRGSRTPQWLEALGYPQVEQTEVQIDVGYSSRFYRLPGPPPPWKLVAIASTPPEGKRLGAIMALEGDRYQVTLGGWLKDYPPVDEAGFLDFARSLPVPDLWEVLQRAQPLGEAITHRFPSNLRRHYERMPRFPEGLAVLGDAHCSFNPIYGQGMTTAALNAEALEACLEEERRRGTVDGARLVRKIRERVADTIAGPWMMATTEDFRYPDVVGERPAGTGLISWYSANIARLSAKDPAVFRAFSNAMHMTKPAAALFAPGMVARVLRHAVLGTPALPPAAAAEGGGRGEVQGT